MFFCNKSLIIHLLVLGAVLDCDICHNFMVLAWEIGGLGVRKTTLRVCSIYILSCV